jgi:hypothetical protein
MPNRAATARRDALWKRKNDISGDRKSAGEAIANHVRVNLKLLINRELLTTP